jgi:hypothetical protein
VEQSPESCWRHRAPQRRSRTPPTHPPQTNQTSRENTLLNEWSAPVSPADSERASSLADRQPKPLTRTPSSFRLNNPRLLQRWTRDE